MTYLGIDVGGSSVKAVGLVHGAIGWTSQSDRYANPSAGDISAAIRQAIGDRAPSIAAVGLCVPGILNETQTQIALSVNLLRLNGLPLADIALHGLNRASARLRILNDTTAAAYDLYLARRLSGRLFLMVLGTGVGVCVMDEQGPLRVDGDSPGHFGQMDVSVESAPIIGPDGGEGSLEGYIGAPALAKAYGARDGAAGGAIETMRTTDAAGRALTRAIRVAHAIYRPQHVILAGGVGTRLGHLIDDLQAAVNDRLTSVARKGWTLGIGEHDFHNAAGAARAAAMTYPNLATV